jgi:ABC-type transporter Mla subunit MlaD
VAEWNVQVKVGLVVVIGLVLLAVLLFNATNWPWGAGGDVLRVHFKAVNDLRIGAGVHLSGVQIGRVTGIEIKADENKVEIRMRVQDAFQRLRQGCKVGIGIIGFVGETYIDLTNGPIGDPLLQPTDLPLIGEDPLSILDIFGLAEQAVGQATQATTSARELIQSNQANISEGITEIRQLVNQTSGALDTVVRQTEESISTFRRLALDNDFRFQRTLTRLNRLIEQLESDSLIISSHAGDITQSVLRLINRNSGTVEQIIDDLQVSASNFRGASQQLYEDLTALKSQFSDLITQSQDAIEAETPKVDRLLENLTTATEDLDKLGDNFAQLLDKMEHGEGSIAQLINSPNALNEARDVLQTADKTMGAIRDLTQTVDQKSEKLKLPDLAWDYELRYVSLEERLHNELAFLLLPAYNQRYRFGLGVREGDVKFEFQYGYDFNEYLHARLGFMRSKVGAGFDIWLLSRRLGITVEGTRLTSENPELNTEVSWRFFPYGHIIIGAENLTDDIRYTAGFRLSARNW